MEDDASDDAVVEGLLESEGLIFEECTGEFLCWCV